MNPSTLPDLRSPPGHGGLATASMICGILTIPSCFVTLLPALIMGHIAWSKAVREGENRSRAKLGLIFGYGSLAMVPVIAMIAALATPFVIRQRQKAELAECINHGRQIVVLLMEYESEHGEFPPDLKQLETKGFTTNLDQLLSMDAENDGEWFYFPKADIGKPNSLLLISPPIGESRMVLHVDNSVTTLREADMAGAIANGSPVRIPVPLRIVR